MVGGSVIDHVILLDKVWVNCREDCSGSECAIYVERTDRSRSISEGDMIWWQGGYAFWTPSFNRVSEEEGRKRGSKCGIDYEIKLKRIGYSGVGRPTPTTEPSK
jgi:hypothetical protein